MQLRSDASINAFSCSVLQPEMAEQRTIKVLLCERLGDPSNTTSHRPLRLVEQAPPANLSPASVRIKVTAAGLNFADSLQVQGQYQEKPKLPFVPGNECSGTVTEVGRDVRTLKVGDKVCAVTTGGAFSEEVVVRENAVVKLPEHADLESAAGLPITFGTAWLALRDRADLRPGQTLLVLGAAGGVGLAAVQLGKVMGARVVAVAKGESKMRILKALGADETINLERCKPEQLAAQIRQAASQGVDVVFDPVGGQFMEQALKCVRWGAQLLVIGFAAGIPKVPLNIALVKNLTVHGVYWGSYAQHEPRVWRRSLDEVARLFANGDITVHISYRYPLDQAAEAFSILQNRGVIGKLLFVTGPRTAVIRRGRL